jgi:hypothetical protein
MLLAFCFYLLLLVGLYKLLKRAFPVVAALASPPPPPPPVHACPVCEAPTDRPRQRCLGCGAMPDETPSYRDGRVVITPRRLIADGRVVRLDRDEMTDVTVAPRALPSGATDGMGCSLLVAGTCAFIAMLYPEGAPVSALVAVAVVALLAAPAFLIFSYTERQELEYAVRLTAPLGGAGEVFASRDRDAAGIVAARLRDAIARGRTVAA